MFSERHSPCPEELLEEVGKDSDVRGPQRSAAGELEGTPEVG